MAATRLLGGRYRLVDRLGEGGMSVVWRAYDEVLGRPVAVKLLTARYAARASSRIRILAAARAAAALSHPHITSVHGFGDSLTGATSPVPYVVMELLSGSTLADRLRSGPLPVRTALQVCAQVASALAAAHGSGLVHRDIKPANVMLTPAGVKVLDFGLAAAAGAPDESVSDGEVWGTPGYLAPERLTAGQVVPASDVYALGLLLYATVTGRRPWQTRTLPELLNAHRFREPAPLPAVPGLPDRVAQLCLRCLAKDPRDRPAAHEVARVLAEAVGWRVSSPVMPRSGALVRAPVPVAVPAPARVTEPAADRSHPVPVRRPRSGRSGRRNGGSGWRAVALAGSAVAVIASLPAGLSMVGDGLGGYGYGVPGPAAAGLGGAVNAGLGPAVPGRWDTDPGPGSPADRPGQMDGQGGMAAGTGSGAGSGSGDGSGGTGGDPGALGPGSTPAGTGELGSGTVGTPTPGTPTPSPTPSPTPTGPSPSAGASTDPDDPGGPSEPPESPGTGAEPSTGTEPSTAP